MAEQQQAQSDTKEKELVCRKHARFYGVTSKDEKIKSSSSLKGQVSGRKSRSKPGRIVVSGKANTLRDLVILVSVLGLLMFITREFDQIKSEEEHDKEEENKMKHKDGSVSRLVSLQENLLRSLQEKLHKRRTDHCSIFFSKSSIPGTGYGLFAGQEFGEGDLVLATVLPLVPVRGMPQGVNNEPVQLFIPAHALVVKHHPYLANVRMTGKSVLNSTEWMEGNASRFDLKASRPIRAGEELFVPLEQHLSGSLSASGYESSLSKLFDHIPTLEDYLKADEITKDLTLTANRMQISQQRRNRGLNTDHIFSLTRRTTSQFDTKISQLLPPNARAARLRLASGYSSSFTALENKTLENLQIHDRCLSDIKHVSQDDNEDITQSETVVVSTRNFKKGEIIAPLPLHVIENTATAACFLSSPNKGGEQSGRCTNQVHLGDTIRPHSSLLTCVGGNNSQVLLCPLSLAAFIPNKLQQGSGGDVNVEFAWEDKTNQQLSVSQVLKFPPGSILWNLVASKPIRANEVLRIKGSGNEVEHVPGELLSMTKVGSDLIPEQWKTKYA